MNGQDIFGRIAALPRERFLALPTALERADRLGAELGIELYLKRDDMTGIGLGGNKLRKLEFILGQARRDGADVLLTTGGGQSNHARLTAAIAARAGMQCELHLRGDPPARFAGNLLLDLIFGAKVSFCGDVTYQEIDLRMAARSEELRRQGLSPLVIPLGGAEALGTIGYVAAFREILDQFPDDDRPLTLAVAGGTGSTAAGLALGAALWAPRTKILVVSASWSQPVLDAEIRRHFADAADRLAAPLPCFPEVTVEAGHVGPGYAHPSIQGCAAVRRMAAKEGIVLDTTYTAKALGGLIEYCEKGRIERAGRVVFVHTGGAPEIFTRSPDDLGLCEFPPHDPAPI